MEINFAKRMEIVRKGVSQSISGLRKVVTNIATFLIARGVNLSMGMEKYVRDVIQVIFYQNTDANPVVLNVRVDHIDVIRRQDVVWMGARVEDMVTNAILSVPINTALRLSVTSKTVSRVIVQRLPLLNARSAVLCTMPIRASANRVVRIVENIKVLLVAVFLVNVMVSAEKDGKVKDVMKRM